MFTFLFNMKPVKSVKDERYMISKTSLSSINTTKCTSRTYFSNFLLIKIAVPPECLPLLYSFLAGARKQKKSFSSVRERPTDSANVSERHIKSKLAP